MYSMTGYGYSEIKNDNVDIIVEIKSVNNRYCDINFKMPYFLNSFENEIKSLILKKANRGKIDIIIILSEKNPTYKMSTNLSLANQYLKIYSDLLNSLDIKDDIKLMHIAKAEGVISVEADRDGEKFWKTVRKQVEKALKDFHATKEVEGKETEKHILECLAKIEDNLDKIRKNSKDYMKVFEEKIKNKIAELIDGEIDENRILHEVGIIASKTDIDEEIERLSSHLKQFKKTCKRKEAIGRQLEFISQEMNREINTIGSKANSIKISELIIEMKTELEKIKEQLRNIE